MSFDAALVIQLVVGAVFAMSALTKLQSPKRFVDGIEQYDILPRSLTPAAATVVLGAEMLIALSHLSGWQLQLGVSTCLALLATFVAVVSIVIKRGEVVECQCFGTAGGDETVSMRTLARLGLLMVFELLLLYFVFVKGHRPTPSLLNASELVPAVACSGLVLIIASWILTAPDIVVASKSCNTASAR